MRLAAIELTQLAQQQGAFDPLPDLIFVTSLLSAADLRALLPAKLRSVPLVVYMHENQAAYPYSDRNEVDAKRDVHFALMITPTPSKSPNSSKLFVRLFVRV